MTQQDRWEEDAGYSPFTLAVEVAGLLAAADIADAVGESGIAAYLRDLADTWNECIERWTYSTNGGLARQIGVDGYYVRIAPPETDGAASPTEGFVPIKNRPPGEGNEAASHVISPDALALVRFGLRAPDDPRILDTIKVIDALLRVKLPQGPCWYRYNDDGYGEHADGSPFDGTGPEQSWDSADIPDRELFLGGPTGSACPLVWAHSEYIKLVRSLKDGKIFDQPPQTVKRYRVEQRKCVYWEWRFNNKCRSMPAGKDLRIAVMAPATVHWSNDAWKTTNDTTARNTGTGIFVADLPASQMSPGQSIVFTFFWPQVQRWEGTDFSVTIQSN